MNSKSIQIGKEDVGKRLDKFLVETNPEFSRSFLQKEIKDGKILVNKEKTSVHFFLREGDKITIGKLEKPVFVLKPNKKLKVPLVFEDENYLVISKPAGMVAHPAEGHEEQDTLANWLIAYLPEIKKIGDDKMRPGIVHRLDGEASGLMVIAKSEKARKSLIKQFDDGTAKKEYAVLVAGNVKEKEGKIETPLGRAKSSFKMVPKADGVGKEAITEYEVLEMHKNFTLLKVHTKTGRMHQIRAHFAGIGHPVAGDEIYGGEVKGLDRMFLHAKKLGFKNLKGEWMEFEEKIPKKLSDFLKSL
jgi:23S rRNA pseudouridine1911/1915/1917 synthase